MRKHPISLLAIVTGGQEGEKEQLIWDENETDVLDDSFINVEEHGGLDREDESSDQLEMTLCLKRTGDPRQVLE